MTWVEAAALPRLELGAESIEQNVSVCRRGCGCGCGCGGFFLVVVLSCARENHNPQNRSGEGAECTKFTAAGVCPRGAGAPGCGNPGGSAWTPNWLKFDNRCGLIAVRVPVVIYTTHVTTAADRRVGWGCRWLELGLGLRFRNPLKYFPLAIFHILPSIFIW